jgi:hypothetical protein
MNYLAYTSYNHHINSNNQALKKNIMYNLQDFQTQLYKEDIRDSIATLSKQYGPQMAGYMLAYIITKNKPSHKDGQNPIFNNYQSTRGINNNLTTISMNSSYAEFHHIENDGVIEGDSSACLYMSLAVGYDLFGCRERKENIDVASHYLKALLYSRKTQIENMYQNIGHQGTEEEAKLFAEIFDVNVIIMDENHNFLYGFCGESGLNSQRIVPLFNNGRHW